LANPPNISESLNHAIELVRDLIEKDGFDNLLKRIAAAPKRPLQQQFSEVADALNEETSDRALAIISAAFLEDVLREMVKRRLVDAIPSALKDAMPRDGSITQFINWALCLGLITPLEHRDSIQVAKIRHRFAHRALHLDFKDVDIEKACNEFALLSQAKSFGIESGGDVNAWPPRDKFRLVVFTLLSLLEMRVTQVERIPALSDQQ
jgi:hypothetical protein